MSRLWSAPISALLLPSALAAALAFTPSDIAQWPRRIFSGETKYRFVDDDGRTAVRAIADDAATALYREIEIDLTETPYIQWSWRIDTLPVGEASERTKAGDDYAARLYIVREGLFGRLSAQALNYVWSRAEPVGAAWPNAYIGRARMIAVESGNERTGQWITYHRNVRADWKEVFGETIERIDGVAIMTDTDDTGSQARAFYGMIRFVSGPPG